MEKDKLNYKEMLLLRGLGVELQNMAYPKIENVTKALETVGYTVVKVEHLTSKKQLLTDNTEISQY